LKRLFSGRFGAYTLDVGLLILTTVFGELLTKYASVDPSSIDMLYILSVAISASYLGFGPSMMLSILSTFAFDVFFVLPLYSLAVSNQQDTINLLILLVVCVVISALSPRIRT
jgi:two-component system, OmpR family, sensor histidine kinase KdpD